MFRSPEGAGPPGTARLQHKPPSRISTRRAHLRTGTPRRPGPAGAACPLQPGHPPRPAPPAAGPPQPCAPAAPAPAQPARTFAALTRNTALPCAAMHSRAWGANKLHITGLWRTCSMVGHSSRCTVGTSCRPWLASSAAQCAAKAKVQRPKACRPAGAAKGISACLRSRWQALQGSTGGSTRWGACTSSRAGTPAAGTFPCRGRASFGQPKNGCWCSPGLLL